MCSIIKSFVHGMLVHPVAPALLALFFNPIIVGADEAIHFHGYGELHYGNTNKSGSVDTMDNHRLVLGWIYRYTSRINLNVEIDYEHAAQEMELEFAFVDFLIAEPINVRMGSMLIPVGYLNEFHEPPLFYSVERPYVQQYVIPTTWQEGGAGIFGSFVSGFRYRIYVVGGLNAVNFTAESGIRKGRSKVSEAPANDIAITGRIEHDGFRGFRFGLSGYRGNAGQGTPAIGNVGVSIIEADIRYRFRQVELSSLISEISIGDTKKINAFTGQTVGKQLWGEYFEIAYHIGRLFLPNDGDLVIFARHERFNTQKKVADGLNAHPENDRKVTTFGASFFPIQRVALKIDIERWKTGNNASWEQVNLGIGYMF
jgi:hypothetical protein